MCRSCMVINDKCDKEKELERFKAIKYFMLALGSCNAFINRRKGGVSIKCYSINKIEKDDFKDKVTRLLLDLGFCPENFGFKIGRISWILRLNNK